LHQLQYAAAVAYVADDMEASAEPPSCVLHVDGNVARLVGELDFHTIAGIRHALVGLPAGTVIDMAEVSFVDSIGISLLIQLDKLGMKLGAVSRQVQHLLNVTGLTTFFKH
jgi:anti-anti-sigma factor